MSRAGVSFAESYLARCDVSKRHSITIAAAPAVVYQAARRLDMSGSRLIRWLFRLRGIPATALNLEGLRRIRFRILEDCPNEGFVLGVIGQFWTPKGHILDFDPARFAELAPDGYAKAVWSFELVPRTEDVTELVTETRVLCTDDASRRRFLRYWAVVGPFSGLIRRLVLRLIRQAAEA